MHFGSCFRRCNRISKVGQTGGGLFNPELLNEAYTGTVRKGEHRGGPLRKLII